MDYQKVFKAAVFDLLWERKYKDERIVLQNAIETDALRQLTTVTLVTTDSVAKAKENLKKSAHAFWLGIYKRNDLCAGLLSKII